MKKQHLSSFVAGQGTLVPSIFMCFSINFQAGNQTPELHYQMIQFLIMYYIICLRHCAPMTANFVEISNALEPT